MNLDVVADYLEQEGAVSSGELFVHAMPEAVTYGALLISSFVGTLIDHELPGYRKTSFQVIVRAQNYTDGFALAEEISNTLTLNQVTEMGDLTVNYIRPRHEPVPYPVSEGNLLEFSVNFDACYVQ